MSEAANNKSETDGGYVEDNTSLGYGMAGLGAEIIGVIAVSSGESIKVVTGVVLINVGALAIRSSIHKMLAFRSGGMQEPPTSNSG